MRIKIQPLGDAAVHISFGDEISDKIHRDIMQMIPLLKTIKGITEWMPAYNTLTVYYRPERISYQELAAILAESYYSRVDEGAVQRLVYEIPVYYGGETGPDLPFVADYHHLSTEEVISLHSNTEYLIYMLGFVPGFPYLGGLSERLAIPRLDHPRLRVPAGSVGIGGKQTGIYPAEVPSGWRIIGITPITLFDIENSPPNLVAAGNYIKFFPITGKEYEKIKEDYHYKISTYKKEG